MLSQEDEQTQGVPFRDLLLEEQIDEVASGCQKHSNDQEEKKLSNSH